MSNGIGWAVIHLHSGNKVRRLGWNGKGMYIVMMPRLALEPSTSPSNDPKVNARTAKHVGDSASLEVLPYIAMMTAQGKWQPGWVCTQEDLLATDWEVVES